MKHWIVAIIITISPCLLRAQVKNTTNVQQTWLGYLNQTRLSNHWGLWADVHLRSKEDWVNNLSQSILRLGLTYYISDHTKLTAGYAYVHHFPADNHKNIAQPEHRPWQQLQWHQNYPKLRLMQWIRLEERFRRKILNNDALADGYNFNWRARYNLMVFLPLGKQAFKASSLSACVNNEVHINFGKQIVNNYFDQNRFFVGLNYHTTAKNSLQFGYMNVFQQLAAGNQYKSTHTARIFYFQNIDSRKKQSKKDGKGISK